jgi:hypothetical protein
MFSFTHDTSPRSPDCLFAPAICFFYINGRRDFHDRTRHAIQPRRPWCRLSIRIRQTPLSTPRPLRELQRAAYACRRSSDDERGEKREVGEQDTEGRFGGVPEHIGLMLEDRDTGYDARSKDEGAEDEEKNEEGEAWGGDEGDGKDHD